MKMRTVLAFLLLTTAAVADERIIVKDATGKPVAQLLTKGTQVRILDSKGCYTGKVVTTGSKSVVYDKLGRPAGSFSKSTSKPKGK